MNVPAPLLTLPPELTERIVAFLRVTDHDSDDGDGPPAEKSTSTSMSASEMSMDDFRAFRSTCKDVYLKTFKLFGRYYFASISVGLTRASLNRLRDLANYRNLFGLTLSEFTSHLTVTAHRLFPESHIGRIFSISDPQEDAQAVIATITLLCDLGIESYNVPGTFNPDVYAIAGKYRKAVASQQSLTTSSCDINKIARAIATFPKFHSITLDAYDNSWGEEDWQEIAGFDRKVFSSFGDIQSGHNNLEFALNRVLQAIAQAETTCQANGRALNLCSLSARAFYGSEEWDPDSRQNIMLQRLDIHLLSRRALQSAFSRLTSLSIDIYDFVAPDEPNHSPQRIKDALQVLLSSPTLKELTIVFVDTGEIVDDDLSNMSRPDHTWIGDQILSTIAEVEQSKSLQRLDFFCLAIVESRDAVENLVKKHAATLKALCPEILIPDPASTPPNISAVRNEYKSLLSALTRCPLLEQFSFHVEAEADECPVAEFDMHGRDWIMKRVQSMITCPTGSEYNDFWADDSELEEEDEGEDEEDDD